VNLSNLNILLQAPVRSKGGPIPLNFMLTANSQIFVSGNVYATTANGTVLARGYWAGQLVNTQSNVNCPGGGGTRLWNIFGITDQNGTFHPLPAGEQWDSANCLSLGNIDDYTTDGTGYEVVIPAGGTSPPNVTVYTRADIGANPGVTITGKGLGTITDAHGNQVNVNLVLGTPNTIQYIDELTTTPVLSYPDNQPPQTTINYTYTDGTSTQRNVAAAYFTSTFNPALFACTGITETSSTYYPLKSVTYPDGSSVQATWKAEGRLNTIIVPTGATYTHTYSGGTHADGLWCESTTKISNATLAISNGTGTWTFARSNPANGTTWTTTVTRPDGSKAVYSFNTGIVTSIVKKDTDGTTVLDTMTYCYDSTFASCNPSAPTNHPTWVRAYHTVPGVATNAEVDTHLDTYGNVVEVDRFDYGPTLINKTLTAYGSWNGSACVSLASIHIVGAPCYVSTYNASSVQQNAAFFWRDTGDGDLTRAQAWAGGSTYLNTDLTYNTNGSVHTSTAPDGVLTTMAYTGAPSCNGFLPTSATTTLGTTSTTWDCNGALPLTSTDLNGLTVTTTYGDPMYRITQISDDGGQAAVLYTYPSVTRASRHTSFAGVISDATTTLNSLGQTLSVQSQKAPSGSSYDTVTYAYNTTGQVSSVSIPCVANLGATCGTHAKEFTYDGAGRPKTITRKTTVNGVATITYPAGDVKTVLSPAPTGENTKISLVEKNGLGWTMRICAVITSGLSGGGNCGERTTGSGYLTLFTRDPLGRATTISQNAQAGATPVNSSFIYDPASRITQKTVPESGTSNFYFDTAHGPCASFKAGHLNQSTDAAGNATCYGYDSLARLTLVTFPSGPYASVTNTKNFAYDSNPKGGANAVGRLARVYSCNSPCTQLVDTQFGFDPYGRTSDVWQTSPGLGSTNYFHTSATYWDNGALKTLTGMPGVPDYNFTLNTQGQIAAGYTPGNVQVGGVSSYDAGGNPLTIAYANGDSDTYLWDAPSQNMTQYQFTLNGVNDKGVLTWNPNGTLKTLAITDSIAGSGDTHTCNTGHDDLVRITSWNCGAFYTESYAFSPDYAGNVTKSGSQPFAPGYTPANNRMLAPYTYDGNGSLLHDATLGQDYTYDSTGAMLSYAGNQIFNDPLGSPVEKVVGSTHTYYIHSPIGLLGTTTSLTAKLSMRE
jgi:YD repeat-containing protein